MAVDPITGASHVKTRQDPTHKVVLTDENAELVTELPVSIADEVDANITNETIEQSTGAVHNTLNIAVGGKDGSGDVQPLAVDTDGDVQVDVKTSALPTGASIAANQQTDALTDTELRAAEIPVFQSETPYNMEYEDGATAYQGWAATGTLTSQSLWRIRRIVTTGADVSIKWADGNASFDNEWDNRASLSYS